MDELEADPTDMLIGGRESGPGEMAGEPEKEPEVGPEEELEADSKLGSPPPSFSFLFCFFFG